VESGYVRIFLCVGSISVTSKEKWFHYNIFNLFHLRWDDNAIKKSEESISVRENFPWRSISTPLWY